MQSGLQAFVCYLSLNFIIEENVTPRSGGDKKAVYSLFRVRDLSSNNDLLLAHCVNTRASLHLSECWVLHYKEEIIIVVQFLQNY